jgi:hypothetical protein
MIRNKLLVSILQSLSSEVTRAEKLICDSVVTERDYIEALKE